jgi:hypothetical protein
MNFLHLGGNRIFLPEESPNRADFPWSLQVLADTLVCCRGRGLAPALGSYARAVNCGLGVENAQTLA